MSLPVGKPCLGAGGGLLLLLSSSCALSCRARPRIGDSAGPPIAPSSASASARACAAAACTVSHEPQEKVIVHLDKELANESRPQGQENLH